LRLAARTRIIVVTPPSLLVVRITDPG